MFKFIKKMIEDSVRNVVAEQVAYALTDVQARLDETSVALAEKVKADDIDYDELANSLIAAGLDYNQIADNIELSDLASEFDSDDVASKVAEDIDTDDIVRQVVDDIDTDDIAERVKDNIEIDYSEIEIDYEELGKALVAMCTK
jgi:hypothetical protein